MHLVRYAVIANQHMSLPAGTSNHSPIATVIADSQMVRYVAGGSGVHVAEKRMRSRYAA
jgi:hypothetical protein